MKKSILLKLLCLSSLLGVVSCGGDNSSPKPSSQTPSSSINLNDQLKWDISFDASNKVFAELVEYDDNYQLMITGSGKMKSYLGENKVPWSDYLSSINEVIIGEGVTNIGDGALLGINVDYIYLADSITSIGENPANANTALLTYKGQDDIIYSDEVKNVYSYVREDIEVEDRHWKSGYSSGDIIPNIYDFDTHKNYWYFGEEGEPVAKTKTKILFIGNSFTYQNGVIENSSGIPGIFDNIAEDLGFKCETYSVTGPGWYLESHANQYDSCGKQIDKLLNACNDFDYIVLQEQSMAPFQNYNKFLNGVKAMQVKIKDTQFNAEIVLYETWGSPYSANEIGSTVAGMEKLLREGYARAAQECGITSISPVGKAFTKSYYDNPNIYLWGGDNRHQGYPGAYLSACTHVAHILGGDVRNTTFKGESKYSAPTLPDATLEHLRNVAYQVAVEKVDVNIHEEVKPEPDPTPKPSEKGPAISEDVLVVSAWGRFIEEQRFNALIEDFKRYLNDNSISYSEIIARYYDGKVDGQGSFRIAKFTENILNDGGTDVVLACATNFNSNQSSYADDKKVEVMNFTPIDIYGQSGRQAAITSEYKLSLAFLTYIKTAEASAILTSATIA